MSAVDVTFAALSITQGDGTLTTQKIMKLTTEQEVRLEEWREEWLQVGLCTDPADRPRAQSAITAMYACLDKPAPIFLWFDSPMSCQLVMHLLSQTELRDQLGDQLGGQLWGQLRGQLRDQLWGQLRDQLEDQLWGQLGDQLGDQLRDQLEGQLEGQLWGQLRGQLRGQLGGHLRDQLGDQLGGQLEGQLGGQLWGQLGDHLWGQLWDQLGSQLWDQLWDQLGSQKIQFKDTNWWGQHDAYWVAYYMFGREIGVSYDAEMSRRLDLHGEVCRSCMWFWLFEGLCILSDRPSEIHRDSRNNLHNLTGPAVGFRDGWGVWSSHGVRLRREIIEQPETITVKDCLEERNAEIRRVMIDQHDKIDGRSYIVDAGGKMVDESIDSKGELRQLWRISVARDEDIVKVRCINSTPEPDGSHKVYWLRVPPATKTAREGLAWTANVDPKFYEPLVET